MTIPVFDYRKDVANVIVRPEIRSRFMRMEPGPAKPMHSHDLGGEIFLVLEGQCEFLVEDERVTCGPGELIYMEPRVKHTLHAVGDEPCVVYLSVTPHVEPTHTRYGDDNDTLPPQYGGWRGKDQPDPTAAKGTAELAHNYQQSIQRLAELVRSTSENLDNHTTGISDQAASADPAATRKSIDGMWNDLRDVLWQVREVEATWNDLAPRGVSTE